MNLDETGRVAGERDARALLECVYGELRRLAHRKLTGETATATMQTTALVHEAWLRLAREGRVTWESRAQFFVAAARAMRRILVERSRTRTRLRHGAAHGRLPWNDDAVAAATDPVQTASGGETLLELDVALDQLRAFDPRLARIVELRAFAGLTEAETGAVLGLSARSVRRDWRAARVWLFRRVQRLREEPRSGRTSRAR